MAKDGLAVTIRVTGLAETRDALERMPDEAKAALKDTAFDLSQKLAGQIRAAAHANGPQSGLMAGTVSTGSDTGTDSDFPMVQAGGGSRVGRNRKPAYKILFGSEFGATFLRQFKPRNTVGYWFYPTVTAASDEIAERWSEAADKVIAEFSSGG